MAEPERVYDNEEGEQQPVTKPNLRELEGGRTANGQSQGQLHSVDDSELKSKTPAQLHDNETSVDQSSSSANASPKVDGPKEDNIGYREENEGKRSRLLFGTGTAGKGKLRRGNSKKIWLGVGALGGAGLLVGLIIILFFIGSLLIPDFASHVTEYEFSRVVRTLSEQNLEITAEKNAIDSIDTNTAKGQQLLKSITDTYSNVRDNTWGKLDQYRPQKIIDNLGTSGELKYSYKTGVLGRQTLSGVTFGGVDHPIQSGFTNNTFHPIQSFKGNVAIANDFGTALETSLRDNGVGLIIRGSVENQIRKELGISLVAWVVGRYQGKSPLQADVQEQQDTYAAADDQSAVGTSGDNNLNQAEKNAATEESQCVESTSCIAATVASGNTEPAQVVASIAKDVGGNSIATNLAGLVNPVIAIGFPVCMINAGSLTNSGPTIDSQDAELQRTYYQVATAADQQKAGNTTGEAVGAMNWKLGNVNQSNAEIEASGGTINTANELSPEASAAGQYNETGILSVLTGGLVGHFLTDACGVFTSPAGIGTSTAIAIVGSVGGDEILDGLSSAVKGIVQGTINKLTTKDGLKEIAGDTSKIVGGTIIAKLIVIQSIGATHNGLATGKDFDNDVQAGANLNANQDMQQQFYGVPMGNADAAQSDQQDQTYVAEQNSTKSIGQRYFAFSNPDSLFSRMAMDLYGAVYGKSVLSSLPSLITKVFNPFLIIPKVFSSISDKGALAASAQNNSANQHYGVVQWGWTPSEEQLIQSNPGYQPLENAKVFTDEATDYANKNNGQDLEQAIQNKFGKCFADTMGVLLSGSDNGGNPEIVRDSNGNVDESQGLCSESQLGPSDNFGGESQSVFRWRLMQSYNNTIDNLSQVQSGGGSSS